MKTGASSLNPYAESYIPLSRRGAVDVNKVHSWTAKDYVRGNETVWSGPYSEDTTQKQHQNNIAHGIPIVEDYTPQGNPGHGFYGSSSQISKDMTEKQIMDEEFDMDLAYLQMTYPGISDDSLSDIYLANKGDLEATVDMLNQLELYTGDSSENLPDTLDFSDMLEPGSSSECASLKLKQVAGEVAGPSSGSSGSAHVT